MPCGRRGRRGRPCRPRLNFGRPGGHARGHAGGRGGASGGPRYTLANFYRNSVMNRGIGGCGGNIRTFFYGNRNRHNNNNNRSGGYDTPDAIQTPQDDAPDPTKVLTVKDIDLKIAVNGKAHHTDKYEISSPLKQNPKLVIRRGQPFLVQIEFSKAYDKAKDDLRLVFEAGDEPLSSKGTYVELILSDDDKPKEWGAKIVSQEGNSLTIEIFTPPTCFIGAWDFQIDVVKKGDTDVEVFSYEHEDPIYIIFNPWCKDDTVYMADENLLKEYVLNESGIVYQGSKKKIRSKPWNFGQFEDPCLEVALYLLDSAELNWAVRGNPILIIRKLSALVNSSDDNGVLEGRWDGNYEGHTPPQYWTGSVAILEEYWKTKREVKYGQCWVFSALSTTICRALGIPTRSVTNFASAHDTDGSITIDLHFIENELDEGYFDDSVWNFHVWNEAWMARPDLPHGYGGWQAFDATPQETSDDVYCCGPVSVNALKHGDVNLPYDGPFVFAEVNADTAYWTTNNLGKLECIYLDKNSVGKFVSTKAPNSNDREDITHCYKYEDESPEERAAVLKANHVGSSRRDIYKKKKSDVKFAIEQDAENTWVGGNFELTLNMKNRSNAVRTVRGTISVNTMFYTGVTADKVKKISLGELKLKAGQDEAFKVVVTQDDYYGKLKDCCMLDVAIMAQVEETEQTFVKREDYRLRKPHLTIKGPSKVQAGDEFKTEVSFTNPFNTSLTGCSVTVDGLSKVRTFQQGNVSPKGTFLATLPITPTKVGETELIITFNSKELEDVTGSTTITIRGR